MLIKSDVFRKEGGFDDYFFAHMEEIDLCWRIKASGYRILAAPGSTVYHLGGGTGGYRGYLDHLGPTQEARWAELGQPTLSESVKEALVEGVDRELVQMDEATLLARRDAALVALAKLKKDFGL